MSSQINTTVSIRTKVLSAAVAAATFAASAALSSAALPGLTPGVNTVTSITTRLDPGVSTTVNNVTGAGAAYSGFVPTNKYTVNYNGDIEKVLTATAGGTTYAASGLANNIIRRFIGPNNDILWYKGSMTGTANGSTVNNAGVALSGFTQAFDQNAVNVGADDLFTTKTTGPNQAPAGNATNVDRVDLLFTAGIAATARSAFVITDRGATNDHDAFDVAGITSLDANGDPSSYGPLLTFANGAWGTTDIVASTNEEILRKNDNIPGDTLHPSDFTNQPVGGVAVTTAALAGNTGAGTIYGYSLFSPDLTVSGDGSGTQLVNYQNLAVYGLADSTSKGGGLDPSATLAVIYSATTAVPEPATATLAVTTAGLLLSRRRKGASRRA